jgi:8-oxo-dGTP diphosphatase
MEPGTLAAVGVWFHAQDTDRYLYLMRSDVRNPGCWALPGGKIQRNENILQAITRECHEELGVIPDIQHLVPLEQFTSADDRFVYHTFFAGIDREFQPRLNHEHRGYAWLDPDVYPRPLHPGLWNTVNFDVVQEKLRLIRYRSN